MSGQYSQVATAEDSGAGDGMLSGGASSETLIDSANVQPTTGVPMIEVIAPATLPEGYKFDANVGSQLVSVTVPQGGVEEGQKFTVPLAMPSAGGGAGTVTSPTNNSGNTSASGATSSSFNVHAMAQPRVQVPIGTWKDHWCNFCGLGCCHAVLCNAYWCTPVILAQVMTRMKLNYLGDAGGIPSTIAMTFPIVLVVFIVYVVLDPFLAFSVIPGTTLTTMRNIINYVHLLAFQEDVADLYDDDRVINAYSNANGGSSIIAKPAWLVDFSAVNLVIGIIFLIYMVYIMTKTRKYIRTKYAIPEQYCPTGCEDLCCSIWCPCCTAAHMARHTADYDMYAASCCTQTGLPSHVPSIV